MMPPLTEERFMDTFMLFSTLTGVRLNEPDFFIDGRQVNPWVLHRTVYLRNGFDSVTMNGEWPIVGVEMGFPPVSCGDPHPLAHCTPAVAHQLHQLYQDTLRHFDQAYSRGIVDQLEYLHTISQRPSPDKPEALLQRHYQPLIYQPAEADYQALLSATTALDFFEEAKNILPLFYDVSAAELEARRVPQHVIAYIEHNREYLKLLTQNPQFCTGFTPLGNPQISRQNLFNGVQAIPRSSLHAPQNRPQSQQQRSGWEPMHGDAMNLSLLQQQIIPALRAQVQQGNMWPNQALDRHAMMQASSAHPFEERSAPQQLPPGFNSGGVPCDNIHQQTDTLAQHAQVSFNDQMNLLHRAQDASNLLQFKMPICQGPQLQNDYVRSSRTPSNPNLLRTAPIQGSQGPRSTQENFPSVPYTNVHSFSAPSASQPPPYPVKSIHDVPIPQLRALSTQLLHVVIEGEKNLQATSNLGVGDIQQQQLRAKIEINKQRYRALQEILIVKIRETGDPTQRSVDRPAQSMSTLSTPYTGVQITGSISSAGAQNHAMPVSTKPAAMNGVQSSSIFTESPSFSQIRRPTQEDPITAKRLIEEKKRIAFRSVPNFDSFAPIHSIPESDIQEYRRNLERLNQVLVDIEKYIHLAFAALKKEEVVERLFNMMANAKSQLKELTKPNPRYVLELHTIRGMIQEADNMDKGLKAVIQRTQSQTISRDGVASTPQPPPWLDSILILPPLTLRRGPSQGESARSPEGAISHREGLFDEEVRIAMGKLEI